VFQAERSLLSASVAGLAHLKWRWVIIGTFLESASMASFTRMQRRILRSGGIRLALTSVLGITYAGNAISVSLPIAGSGVGTAFTHRQFSAHGASRAVATWVLAISGVLSTIAFTLVVSVGAIISSNLAAEVAGAAGALLVVIPVTITLLAVRRP
jgi:uncharacterized membrane protein YbhN (UPF0104 family)